MEWADTHPWEVTRRRRPRRQLEAAFVGLVFALLYLILEPQSLDRSRHEIAAAVSASMGLAPAGSDA
jgi:hypothetical protein